MKDSYYVVATETATGEIHCFRVNKDVVDSLYPLELVENTGITYEWYESMQQLKELRADLFEGEPRALSSIT